jgi:hypothetical protein
MGVAAIEARVIKTRIFMLSSFMVFPLEWMLRSGGWVQG